MWKCPDTPGPSMLVPRAKFPLSVASISPLPFVIVSASNVKFPRAALPPSTLAPLLSKMSPPTGSRRLPSNLNVHVFDPALVRVLRSIPLVSDRPSLDASSISRSPPAVIRTSSAARKLMSLPERISISSLSVAMP